MPCCGGASCACKVTAGDGMVVTGSGTTHDPFVIGADLRVADNSTFDLTLVDGLLTVEYADTARLQDIPDVSLNAPFNGDALLWSETNQRWEPSAVPTADAGSVQNDDSLNGNGSVLQPLTVNHHQDRGTDTFSPDGIGLTDTTLQGLVVHHVDLWARDLYWLAPELNTLSMLNTAPGQIDYWNGTHWVPIPGSEGHDQTGQMLAISGNYVEGARTKRIIRQVATSTDSTGQFDVLTEADLTDAAGVLTCQFQEQGPTAYKAVLDFMATKIIGKAYRLTTGATWNSTAIKGTVEAVVYY